MSFNQDIQSLEPGEIIKLIEVDGSEFGLDTVLRFHAYNIAHEGWAAFTDGNLPAIIWKGELYEPYPYELADVELSSSGAQPTPTLSVGNVGGYVTSLCLAYDDLVKAKVRIRTTLAKYLDAANWTAGNPSASPNDERVQLFFINAKTAETRVQVDFELCSPFDIQNLQLPTRQIIPVCTWALRGLYRSGTGCDYAGTNYFLKDGTPTDNPGLDICGGRLSDCKLRFGENNPLPFGGFPAANLQTR